MFEPPDEAPVIEVRWRMAIVVSAVLATVAFLLSLLSIVLIYLR